MFVYVFAILVFFEVLVEVMVAGVVLVVVVMVVVGGRGCDRCFSGGGSDGSVVQLLVMRGDGGFGGLSLSAWCCFVYWQAGATVRGGKASHATG